MPVTLTLLPCQPLLSPLATQNDDTYPLAVFLFDPSSCYVSIAVIDFSSRGREWLYTVSPADLTLVIVGIVEGWRRTPCTRFRSWRGLCLELVKVALDQVNENLVVASYLVGHHHHHNHHRHRRRRRYRRRLPYPVSIFVSSAPPLNIEAKLVGEIHASPSPYSRGDNLTTLSSFHQNFC